MNGIFCVKFSLFSHFAEKNFFRCKNWSWTDGTIDDLIVYLFCDFVKKKKKKMSWNDYQWYWQHSHWICQKKLVSIFLNILSLKLILFFFSNLKKKKYESMSTNWKIFHFKTKQLWQIYQPTDEIVWIEVIKWFIKIWCFFIQFLNINKTINQNFNSIF